MQNTAPISLSKKKNEKVYVGIDVSKKSHVAGFVSQSLLRLNRFNHCPTFNFENSRAGFDNLINEIQQYASLEQSIVLMENTGHYHRPLQQYLFERGIQVFQMHARKRMSPNKTDKNDALALANVVYNQVELKIQVTDPKDAIHPSVEDCPEAKGLKRLLHRREDLTENLTRRKNMLIGITDELMPEFTEIFRDPCGPVALNVRRRFPTPSEIKDASIQELATCRQKAYRPGLEDLQKLKMLARCTIGTQDKARVSQLRLEQTQIIDEIYIMQTHLQELDAEIERVVTGSRMGQILLSMPAIGMTSAAAIIVAIGNIQRFDTPGKLKNYFGWAPNITQTGTSKNTVTLTSNGQRHIKKVMYLVAWRAIIEDTEWKEIYQRLVIKNCPYNAQKGIYLGKKRVIGRIIGQMINMIYKLLKQDDRMINSHNDITPEPILYNREIHRQHRMRGAIKKL